MRTTRSVVVCFLFTVAATLALLTATARAQLVPDGGTNVLDGVTNSVSGDLTVGTNGSFTMLSLTNATVVDVSGQTFIGRDTGSFSNVVDVTGSGSLLSTTNDLYVGSNGWGNELIITDGGSVSNFTSTIGATSDSVSNRVLITGPSSLWTNAGQLTVGLEGAFNSLVISNGGTLIIGAVTNNGYSTIIGAAVGSSNNSALISGSGSSWHNRHDVIVGGAGSFNSLRIADGGKVNISSTKSGFIGGTGNKNHVIVSGSSSAWYISQSLHVGYFSSFNTLLITDGGTVTNRPAIIGFGAGANSNYVIVNGTNSAWHTSMMSVGSAGAYNSLLVTNGGTVTSKIASFRVGLNNNSSSNNQVTVDGGVLLVTNVANTNVLQIRRGICVFNAGLIKADKLVLTNSEGLFQFNGGTLNVRTTTVTNGFVFTAGNGTNEAIFDVLGVGPHVFANGLLIQTNATLTGTGTINGSVTNCGTIFLTNADQMLFTGSVVNKGVIIAVTGTPRFGSTFTNLGTLITTASINVANVSVSGPDIVLQFNSVSNYIHEVQASTNVSSGLWQTLTNGLLGTGSPITFTDPGGALTSNRTYRVLLH